MPRRDGAKAPREPSPLPLVVVSLVVLGALVFARARSTVARRPSPPTRRRPTLDAAGYLQVIAPGWRAAGCATATCHGAPGASFALSPELDAAGALAEFSAVTSRVRAGDPGASPLRQRARDGHAGSTPLREGGCLATQLDRWLSREGLSACDGGP
ncbi:MAG: hypothetical protein R3A52_11380 [Polyangiales bacterium]